MRRAGLLALTLVLAGCVGPKPEVASVTVSSVRDGIAVVTLVLENRGRGEGEVAVDVTVRERATGAVVGRDELGVELHAHERVAVSREVRVTGAAELVAEAEARYPP